MPSMFSSSGDDALYQAEIQYIRPVILDVMIPGRNGFEVCRELAENLASACPF